MDNDILQDETGGLGSRYAIAIIAPLTGGLLVALGNRSVDGAELMVPLIVGVVVVLAVVMAAGIYADRASQVMSRGPLTRGQVYTNAPPQILQSALMAQLARRGIEITGGMGTMGRGRKAASLSTWGTTAVWDVRPSADRPGLGVVTLVVKPSSPLQFSEWGRGVKLGTKTLQALPGVVAYRDPKDPSQIIQLGAAQPPR